MFRSDLGHGASVDELEALSGKKRRARLDAIRDACRAFITGPFCERLSAVAEALPGRLGAALGGGLLDRTTGTATGKAREMSCLTGRVATRRRE